MRTKLGTIVIGAGSADLAAAAGVATMSSGLFR